jgi:hypothetical protein
MASEGIMAIPFQDEVKGESCPFIRTSLNLSPRSHATNHARQLCLHTNWSRWDVVVLSTSAGMYRYSIGDVVRVLGFVGSTPL